MITLLISITKLIINEEILVNKIIQRWSIEKIFKNK